MKALTLQLQNGQPALRLSEQPTPEPGKGEVLVKLSAAALNRRDYWISVGKYPGLKDGVVLGSDGCGEVVTPNSQWLGKKVLINPNVDWGESKAHQSSDYSVLGMPTNGTIAEYIAVPEHRLIEKPAFLSDEEAAAVPLAGLTAYRTVTSKGQIAADHNVLVTGIGGGVSQFALSFAKAIAANTFVTSGSEEKLAKAADLWACAGFNYKDEDWPKKALKAAGKFDVIIDSAGGNSINDYLKMIKPAGRIVVYGSTTGKTEGLDLFRLFWSQASLIGSTMGNDEEFEKMIGFVSHHKIKPVVENYFTLDQAVEAVASMSDPSQFGKVVIRMV